MRISTSMIFDAGVAAMNRQTATLLHLQQQVATGRRILTPADDPVAAARALEVQQSRDVLAQYGTNQSNAKSSLGQEEAQLTSAEDLLTRIRELAVQGGNAALSGRDRESVALELRARFDELMGIANATDGTGQYVFSGYMGSTKPFGGNVDNLLAAPGNEVVYMGDDGQRRLQVSGTRFLEVSDSGNDVFKRIKNGNGYFTTDYTIGNSGTGVIDAGNVTDPAAWNSLPPTSKNLSIQFYVDNTVVPPVTYYDLIDSTANVSLLTGVAPAAPTFPGVPAGLRTYQPNQPIAFNGLSVVPSDYGISVAVSGEPGNGDSFSLAPSQSQSIFKTLANLIGALEDDQSDTPAGSAVLANEIGFALTNIDQSTDNLLRVRAAIGSRLNEVESLENVNGDLDLQYQQTLSNLQDLDYAKAITDLTRKQLDLEAAQKSFSQVSQLSLFRYL